MHTGKEVVEEWIITWSMKCEKSESIISMNYECEGMKDVHEASQKGGRPVELVYLPGVHASVATGILDKCFFIHPDLIGNI